MMDIPGDDLTTEQKDLASVINGYIRQMNRYGRRQEQIVNRYPQVIAWNNGTASWYIMRGGRAWMNLTRPGNSNLRVGDYITLDANELLVYAPMRDLKTVLPWLDPLPLYGGSYEARQRGIFNPDVFLEGWSQFEWSRDPNFLAYWDEKFLNKEWPEGLEPIRITHDSPEELQALVEIGEEQGQEVSREYPIRLGPDVEDDDAVLQFYQVEPLADFLDRYVRDWRSLNPSELAIEIFELEKKFLFCFDCDPDEGDIGPYVEPVKVDPRIRQTVERAVRGFEPVMEDDFYVVRYYPRDYAGWEEPRPQNVPTHEWAKAAEELAQQGIRVRGDDLDFQRQIHPEEVQRVFEPVTQWLDRYARGWRELTPSQLWEEFQYLRTQFQNDPIWSTEDYDWEHIYPQDETGSTWEFNAISYYPFGTAAFDEPPEPRPAMHGPYRGDPYLRELGFIHDTPEMPAVVTDKYPMRRDKNFIQEPHSEPLRGFLDRYIPDWNSEYYRQNTDELRRELENLRKKFRFEIARGEVTVWPIPGLEHQFSPGLFDFIDDLVVRYYPIGTAAWDEPAAWGEPPKPIRETEGYSQEEWLRKTTQAAKEAAAKGQEHLLPFVNTPDENIALDDLNELSPGMGTIPGTSIRGYGDAYPSRLGSGPDSSIYEPLSDFLSRYIPEWRELTPEQLTEELNWLETRFKFTVAGYGNRSREQINLYDPSSDSYIVMDTVSYYPNNTAAFGEASNYVRIDPDKAHEVTAMRKGKKYWISPSGKIFEIKGSYAHYEAFLRNSTNTMDPEPDELAFAQGWIRAYYEPSDVKSFDFDFPDGVGFMSDWRNSRDIVIDVLIKSNLKNVPITFSYTGGGVRIVDERYRNLKEMVETAYWEDETDEQYKRRMAALGERPEPINIRRRRTPEEEYLYDKQIEESFNDLTNMGLSGDTFLNTMHARDEVIRGEELYSHYEELTTFLDRYIPDWETLDPETLKSELEYIGKMFRYEIRDRNLIDTPRYSEGPPFDSVERVARIKAVPTEYIVRYYRQDTAAFRAYHGTWVDFDGPPSASQITKERSNYPGLLFLTTEPRYASDVVHMLKGGRIYPVEVSDNAVLWNPDKDEWPEGYDDQEELWFSTYSSTNSSFSNLFSSQELQWFTSVLKSKGFDGIAGGHVIIIWNDRVVQGSYVPFTDNVKTAEQAGVKYTFVLPVDESVEMLLEVHNRWNEQAESIMNIEPDRSIRMRAQFAADVAYIAAENLQKKKCCVIIAYILEPKFEVLGISVYQVYPDKSSEISLVSVAPRLQPGTPGAKIRGIGTGLLCQTAIDLKSKNAQRVCLRPLDSIARTFWYRRGFTMPRGTTELCVTSIDEIANKCSNPECPDQGEHCMMGDGNLVTRYVSAAKGLNL